MNVCGVLVHANPAKTDDVIEAMRALDGLEVHRTADAGRIIVTVEDTDQTLALDTLTAIHKLDGIVAASLVYHCFDPAAATPADA
jgi:periplasmic nitrate reductase NapD